MSDEIMAGNEETTDAQATTTESQDQAQASSKTYTQAEFDNHMAGLKNSLQKKFEKQFAELGDIEELKQLKQNAEKQKEEEALKRGEFDKIIQDLAAKKDSEIEKRDQIIKEYKVDTPLLNAAAENRSVNPEQVKALLKSQVKMTDEGEVQVVDTNQQTRYTDQGTPMGVTELVSEFLQANPHFVQPTPATTNTKSSVTVDNSSLDISRLDMKNPDDRRRYADWKKQQQQR